MRALVSAFKFPSDPRIIVVSRIEDFALMREPGVLGVMMPNPVIIPTDPAYMAAVMDATRPANEFDDRLYLIKPQLDNAPACIRDTGRLLHEAVRLSGTPIGSTFSIRQNSDDPVTPHAHHPVAMADIFGTATVGYLGDRKERPHGRYDFPLRHITVFRDIWHAAGNLVPGQPRLNMILG
jgi:hypothetical protein